MKILVVNRKITLSIFVILMLIWGMSDVSYGDVCQVGDVLSPGESCTYPGTDIEFSVLDNGSGRFLFFTAGTGINARNITINGVKYNFAASKRADGKWEIEASGNEGDQQTDIIEEPDPADTPQQPKTSNPKLSFSTPSPLTEATLHESVVTLTLSGGTYARSRIDIGNALKVSGIQGVTTSWLNVERISDTEITVELGFDGNIDTDATLTFTVGAAAIVNYNGPALTTQISVAASTETSEPPRDGGNTQQPVAPEQSKAPAEDFEQDSIEGPWLWMVVPTDPAGGDGISTEIDSLADASGGTITEAYVAQNGVSEGDSIGQARWTSGEIYWSDHQCRKYKAVAAVIDANAAAAPSLYTDALERLTSADVRLWLSEARGRDLTDPHMHARGLLFLEQLLAVLTPKETALLANYPNPFNPETWIPYQLAKDAEVTLTIYAVNGHVVRRLSLGHQPAGVYQERSRAAYWDGKNAFGEPVASGLYFYTLTTSDFSATRKMLIRK